MLTHHCGPGIVTQPYAGCWSRCQKEIACVISFFLGEVLGITLFELLDTTRGINELLFAGKVWMALRTDLNLDLFHG